MGVTRVQRLLQLISLLRSGQALDADEIAKRMKISRRTVFRDLEMIERAGVPCRFDQERRGYVIDAWYFLPPVSLTLPEALALHLAVFKLASPQNFPMYNEAQRATRKISQALPAGLRDQCTRIAQVFEARWPAHADARVIGASFQRLQVAAAECRKVRLRYDSYYEAREIVSIVHPYLVAMVNRAWYLFAHSELHGEARTFRLDRVLSSEVLAETFVRPSGFSLDKHIGKAWTLVPEGKIWHVKLHFMPKVAGNVEEVMWHQTQRMQRLADGSLVFEVDVDGLGEISWWVMGYGDQVIVLEPEELRIRVQKMAEGILRHYRG